MRQRGARFYSAPRRLTSPNIIARLYKESAAILQDRSWRKKVDAIEFEAVVMDSVQFGALIHRKLEKWGKVVKATGAKAGCC